uniref:Delta-like protein n=1 Tax=Strigamia maritima TaxID=126957 RepID=T1JH02_STRMM
MATRPFHPLTSFCITIHRKSFVLQIRDVDIGGHSDAVIERTIFKGIVNPGSDWHTMTHNGPVAQFTYRVRVLCDPHYYNATCTKFCRPRDDYFGHYTCDSNGDKVCVPGWMSTNCDKAMCKPGCNSIHGYCDTPGDCKTEVPTIQSRDSRKSLTTQKLLLPQDWTQATITIG